MRVAKAFSRFPFSHFLTQRKLCCHFFHVFSSDERALNKNKVGINDQGIEQISLTHAYSICGELLFSAFDLGNFLFL
jgi:hypothetical protein